MVACGPSRPSNTPNLWVSSASIFEEPEWLDFEWDDASDIKEIQILFDSALQFHFWQSWQGYPVNAIPSIVRDYRIVATDMDGIERVVVEVGNNYQRNCRHAVDLKGIRRLRIQILATNGLDRAQVYSVRVLSE